jgi:hypothetical protein
MTSQITWHRLPEEVAPEIRNADSSDRETLNVSTGVEVPLHGTVCERTVAARHSNAMTRISDRLISLGRMVEIPDGGSLVNGCREGNPGWRHH